MPRDLDIAVGFISCLVMLILEDVHLLVLLTRGGKDYFWSGQESWVSRSRWLSSSGWWDSLERAVGLHSLLQLKASTLHVLSSCPRPLPEGPFLGASGESDKVTPGFTLSAPLSPGRQCLPLPQLLLSNLWRANTS